MFFYLRYNGLIEMNDERGSVLNFRRTWLAVSAYMSAYMVLTDM